MWSSLVCMWPMMHSGSQRSAGKPDSVWGGQLCCWASAARPHWEVPRNHLWLDTQALHDDNCCLILQHLACGRPRCQPPSSWSPDSRSKSRMFSQHERVNTAMNQCNSIDLCVSIQCYHPAVCIWIVLLQVWSPDNIWRRSGLDCIHITSQLQMYLHCNWALSDLLTWGCAACL